MGVKSDCEETGTSGRAGRRNWRATGWATCMIAAIALFAFAVGLVRFAGTVSEQARHAATSGEAADGIVVLTGGSSRIADAVDLLADNRGRRLLISGVNPTTTLQDIRLKLDSGDQLFDCCIDLGYQAQNTFGNAMEAGRWSRANEFGSLVVVTSSYHMPRSLMELNRVLPDIKLIPHAVESSRLDLSRWWASGDTVWLMLTEYTKYLLAAVHIRLGDATLSGEETADEVMRARAG